jgi:Uri superfamily endonuclease
MPAFRGKSLSPGLYAYCGNAYSPGGIRARVSRHRRAGKPLRWHLLHLPKVETLPTDIFDLVVLGGREVH